MARFARIVIPGTPHLVTQKGLNEQDVFFNEGDARAYIYYLSRKATKFGLSVWAYSLLPNKVHLLCVPEKEDSLRLSFGETHRRYANRMNKRQETSGNLWHSRFSSFPLAEDYILPAAHFVEMAPVIAGLTKQASSFKWSSARAHLYGENDILCDILPLLARKPDWESLLGANINLGQMQKISSHIKTGRPLGNATFIEKLEDITGRALKKKKPGRKASSKKKAA